MAKFCRFKSFCLFVAFVVSGFATLRAETKKAVIAKPATSTIKPSVVRPAKPAPLPKASPPPLAPGEIPLAAKAAALIDVQSGGFLYQKNPDEVHYPASTTKILTALIVIEAGDLDKMVSVDIADTKVEPSALEIKPGEQFTRRHLLYALLLKSANDVAML